MQGCAQKVRRLTVDLFMWSTTSIVAAGELGFADSGEVLIRLKRIYNF
jgi:hypothetical protein